MLFEQKSTLKQTPIPDPKTDPDKILKLNQPPKLSPIHF